MKTKLVLVLMLLSFKLFPQISDNQKDMFDDILDATKKKPKMFVHLDNKNSFIGNRKGWFLGIKGGLEYNNLIRFGLGFSFLYNQSHSSLFMDLKKTSQNIYFQYISLFSEYIFHNSERYDLSIPISLNFGNSYLKDNGNVKKYGIIVFYETQLNAMYYFFKYIGLGAGVGYRLALINNRKMDSRITAPIYTIKLKLKLSK